MQSVTEKPYYASVERSGDQFVVRLPILAGDVPKNLTAQGDTVEAALDELGQKLRRQINDCKLHGEQVATTGEPGWFSHIVKPAPVSYDADAGKALLAYLQAESAAAEANVHLADGRARQNGLLALAALPVLNFLLAGQAPANRFESLLVIVTVLGIIGTLVLTLLATRTFKLKNVGILPKCLKQHIEWVDDGFMDQKRLLYVLQDAWLRSIQEYKPVADTKFQFVNGQIVTLGMTLAALLILYIYRLS